MRQEDNIANLISGSFKLLEGSESLIVYCLDDSKHYCRGIPSSGYPLNTLELHSCDDNEAVATVFSCNLGKRFVIVFNLSDVRPV